MKIIGLTVDKYQALAMRTSPRDGHDKIDNGVLGLIGETGELVDVYKKWQYQSGDDALLPAERLADELGDVLWYLAELADGMDMPLCKLALNDFRDLDAAARKPGGRTRSLRSLVIGLNGRANRMSKAVDRGDTRNIGVEARRMLAGMARLANLIGSSLEAVARANIKKLEKRYPEGFDPEISMRRYEG